MDIGQRESGRPQPNVVKKVSGTSESEKVALSDRELHDRIIGYLTDANLRSTGASVDFLDQTAAERAGRFSRFLARRYYRDRLQRSFRYSAVIMDTRRRTGRVSPMGPSPSVLPAEHIVETPEFEILLNACVLGSLGTANAVAALAVKKLLPLWEDAWWAELLEYERAFFLQLATSEPTPACAAPQKSTSTAIHDFEFHMPTLLDSVRHGGTAPGIMHSPVTLLFSRTPHGRIYVVEPDDKMLTALQAVDGHRSTAEIAACLGSSVGETERILNTLAEIGAVVLP